MTGLFQGYDIIEKLYESQSVLILRVADRIKKTRAILKILKGEYPNPEYVARFKREYEILRDLNASGVIKVHSLEKQSGNIFIVMEDIGAESLDRILKRKRLKVSEFLELAIRISSALGEIHQSNIIHKDINPSNIVLNEESGELRIIDFSISAELPREITSANEPDTLEGTLAYISPEKTGRMNRMLDYRTDLYSLGVTLYELLTGQLPFNTSDPSELIYCHIAKEPLPPHLLKSYDADPALIGCEVLSRIILRLMAKNAEDRYQSTYGLRSDLQNCLDQLYRKGKIDDFEIAMTDYSSRFQLPQRLYGREKEINTLLDSFYRVCTGTKEVMMVVGYAGIGKSVLVNEVHKYIIARNGYFISGKFNQFDRNIPYFGLIQSLQQLIRQIVTEKKESIDSWRERILGAVGPNGQLIIDVIPEVEMIIGKQPPVPELPSQESQNRFNLYFQNFIRAFSSKKQPLIIFLDDIQWADLPSLKSIRLLMTDNDTRYLLLIGAYRNNEVEDNHPLLKTLDDIRGSGTFTGTLNLPSLDYENVNHMVAETLKCNISRTEELAKLCRKKTLGNPFFIKQFLQTLYNEGLFVFDSDEMSWQWDIEKISRMGITENVVDLMVKKIRKLPERTQSVLKLAACIGNQFDLRTLSIVNEKRASDTAGDLWEALKEEFVLPLSDSYKFIQTDYDEAPVVYRFSHDRIRQAVNSLLDEYQNKKYHIGIGRLLLTKFRNQKLEDEIFEIVKHFNSGKELIDDVSERFELSGLNLLAGKKAKMANAYEPALGYFSVGLELLGDDSWDDQYELTLNLLCETVEVLFLTGDFERMDLVAGNVLDHSKSILDKVRIYEIIISSLIARARLNEGVNTAIEVLKQLGVVIPKKPTKAHILVNLIRLRIAFLWKNTDYLRHLPEMSDPYSLAAMRILMSAASSAYRSNVLVVTIMLQKMVRLSVRYGNSPFSPFAYGMYAIFLVGIIGAIDRGYKYGKFSIDLLSEINAKEYNAKINILFNLFVKHWKDPLRETVDHLFEGYQYALETGDLEFACYGLMYSVVHSMFSGKSLELVNRELEECTSVVRRMKQERTLINVKFHRQFALNLMGLAEDKTMLIGDSFNEREAKPLLINLNDRPSLGSYNANKTIISYIFEKEDDALLHALEVRKYTDALVGLFYVPVVYFYTSLVFLSQIKSKNQEKRTLFLRRVAKNQRALHKWALNAPENQMHRWLLVEAERYRVTGKELSAIRHYNMAIDEARKNNFMMEEALSNELTAKFYLKSGNKRIASAYMAEARRLYSKWGARAKVEHLDDNYSELFGMCQIPPSEISAVREDKTDTKTLSSDRIDMRAIQQASQAISQEIQLDRLLEKLLAIVTVNAGAQRGMMLLVEGNELYLEGEVSASGREITVLQHVPLSRLQNLSQSVVNYVVRTGETLVISDAGSDTRFGGDDYIIRGKPRSLLCMQLVNQNKLSGVLYLENNLASGAFTPQRVETLEMLTGEIIISIENAKLYKSLREYSQTLEDKVEKRTKEITYKNEQLNRQKEELKQALEDLKQSQYQLIQSEKMASLGQLVAGIAHEINNPVNFISAGVDSLSTNMGEIMQLLSIYEGLTPENVKEKLGMLERLKENVDYGESIGEITKLIETIKNGTKRTTEIIKGLRSFSRMDDDIIRTADIHEGLDSTLVLLHNKYRERIEIVRNYDEVPLIECFPGQLNQVFMNILSNAIDSIDKSGRITITTKKMDGMIRISIKDNGKGIPQKYYEKIFEPFFTTKEVGKGTGLGLSISHGIIKRHNGTIEFSSKPDEGTEFIITIPVSQKAS